MIKPDSPQVKQDTGKVTNTNIEKKLEINDSSNQSNGEASKKVVLLNVFFMYKCIYENYFNLY